MARQSVRRSADEVPDFRIQAPDSEGVAQAGGSQQVDADGDGEEAPAATATIEKPAGDGPTPADLIEPEVWYDAKKLGELLSIAPEDLDRLDNAGRFTGYRRSKLFRGREVLALIASGELSAEVTQAARDLAAAKARALRIPEPAKPSAIDEGLAEHERRESERLQAAQADEDQRWAHYAAVLLRSADPRPEDANTLACIMRDSQFTPDRVRRDLELVKKARNLLDLHAERDAANQRRIEASQAFRDLKDRHEREEHAAWKADMIASAHARECSEAAWHLECLRREAPYLFTSGGNPPQLRSIVPAPEACSASS